jgi:hypothetical protein
MISDMNLYELNGSSASSQALSAVQDITLQVQNQFPADGGFMTAMTNLATATSADREKVATLTKAIASYE